MSYIGKNIQYDSLLGTEVTALKDYKQTMSNENRYEKYSDIKIQLGTTDFLKQLFNHPHGKEFIKEFFRNQKNSKKSLGYYGLLFHYITHEIPSEHKDIINKIKREFGRQNANGETLMKILINDPKVQNFITYKNFQNSRRKLLKAIINIQTKKTPNLDHDQLNLKTLEILCNNIFENNILKDVFFIGGGDEGKVKKEIKDKLIRSILTEEEEKEIKQKIQIKSELHERRIEQYKQVREAREKHDTENEELISNANDEVLVKEVMKKDDEEIKKLKAKKEEEQEKHKQHTQRRVNERKKAKANPQEGEQEPEAAKGGRRTRKRKGRKGRKSKKQRKGRKGRKKARKTKRKNGRKTKSRRRRRR